MSKQSQSIDGKIVNRIENSGRGWVFTASDFLDIGSRDAVDQALSRRSRRQAIRKIARGIYDFPRQDPQLGLLFPTTEAIAAALRKRDAIRLQPSGAYAANRLGLSSQVPMKVVFLTDGPTRRVTVGKLQIRMKRTTPRNMATAGTMSGLVIQGLRHIGQKQVTSAMIEGLHKRLTEKEKQQLLQDLRYAPAWVAQIMRQIVVRTGR